MPQTLDLVSTLSLEERAEREFSMNCISPDDGKYFPVTKDLVPYLSVGAEWNACTLLQKVILETRVEFGRAEQRHLDEVISALPKISALNIALLEDQITRHDQLAVIGEIGRFVSPETKALLHPGTTSYDILDTARSYIFKKAWFEVMRPKITSAVEKLIDISERSMDYLQVGRTHLKDTSPVLFGGFMATYVGRFAERLEKLDSHFSGLKGKVSGIVGTGAGIEMVIGRGKAMEFEEEVLKKLELEPDYTATQIVQKERLADVGNGLTTLMLVLKDFANDIRLLYSSAIGEVFSSDNAERLGGSSTDALKDNPINYENMKGKAVVVESGMRLLYELISTDLQRELSGSVIARYQPQAQMSETYESFTRLNKALPKLTLNEERLAQNLQAVRNRPSEAMVTILRGEVGWVHSQYGAGHDFVKEMGKRAIKTRKGLLEVALEDSEFRKLYGTLSPLKQDILKGNLEKYTGDYRERAAININHARSVINK